MLHIKTLACIVVLKTTQLLTRHIPGTFTTCRTWKASCRSDNGTYPAWTPQDSQSVPSFLGEWAVLWHLHREWTEIQTTMNWALLWWPPTWPAQKNKKQSIYQASLVIKNELYSLILTASPINSTESQYYNAHLFLISGVWTHHNLAHQSSPLFQPWWMV